MRTLSCFTNHKLELGILTTQKFYCYFFNRGIDKLNGLSLNTVIVWSLVLYITHVTGVLKKPIPNLYIFSKQNLWLWGYDCCEMQSWPNSYLKTVKTFFILINTYVLSPYPGFYLIWARTVPGFFQKVWISLFSSGGDNVGLCPSFN